MARAVSQITRATVRRLPGNGVQLARTLLAISTLITLVGTPDSSLFRLVLGAEDAIACNGALVIGAYCAIPVRWIATAAGVLIALWVISGWLPRYSAIPQAWFAFSFDAAVAIGEGGDQVNHNLSLILAVIALFDSRRNAWSIGEPMSENYRTRGAVSRGIMMFALVLAQLQVAFIYFHSGVGKATVSEWSEGSAVYYIVNGQFGVPRYLDFLGEWVAHPVVSIVLTWSVIGLEILLALAVIMPDRLRRCLILVGLAFHLGIIVFMGLWSFGFAMFACLVIVGLRTSPAFESIWQGQLRALEEDDGEATEVGRKTSTHTSGHIGTHTH